MKKTFKPSALSCGPLRPEGRPTAFSYWRDRAATTSEASAECLALWRPAWEAGTALWCGAAAAGGLALLAAGLAPEPAAVYGGLPALLAALRLRGALRVWARRAPLSGRAPAFMSYADVALRMRAMTGRRLPEAARRGTDAASAVRLAGLLGRSEGFARAGGGPSASGALFCAEAEGEVEGVWFGLGFPWTPVEAQRLYELSRVDWRRMLLPPALRRRLSGDPGLPDDAPGLPVIHGVGAAEAPIVRPISSLGGGTLLVGTTQAGKGVVLSSLVTQAILRGDAVIVIDPKSSKRLRNAVAGACRAAGRPAPLEFHPAFPKRGVRLNPLGSYTRPTEIASRICAVLPEGDGAFTAFAWRAVHVMTEGLLFVGRQPSLAAYRSLLERGVESLLEAALRRDLTDRVPGWEALHADLMADEARTLRAPPGSTAGPELLAMVTLWERTAGRSPGLGRDAAPDPEAIRGPAGRPPEPAVEGLLSVFRHSREHYAKITASLLPALSMLTAGPLGESLSPDPDADDPRPIVTLEGVVESRGVLYLGLDALPDAATASALGSLLLSDLSGAAGRRYNVGASGAEAVRTCLFVDETANVINRPLIEILNKGMEAGFQCCCAMQTVADLEARLGSAAAARMALGNLNNLIALRTKDESTQKFVAEAFGRTTIWETSASVSSSADSGVLPTFRATAGRSLSGRRESVVPLECLGQLPNLEFFASLSGGRLWKGRMPILNPELEGLKLFAGEAGWRRGSGPAGGSGAGGGMPRVRRSLAALTAFAGRSEGRAA